MKMEFVLLYARLGGQTLMDDATRSQTQMNQQLGRKPKKLVKTWEESWLNLRVNRRMKVSQDWVQMVHIG